MKVPEFTALAGEESAKSKLALGSLIHMNKEQKMRTLFAAFRTLSFLLLFMTTACSSHSMSNEEPITIKSTLTPETRLLPLIVKVDPGSKLYQDPTWAIEIIEIVADGEPINKEKSLSLFLDINTKSMTVEEDLFVYAKSLDRMYFGELNPEGGPLSLFEYSIPENVGKLEIKYRLVYSGGRPGSQIYKLKALRSR